jgi:hypothetical protein
MGDLVVNVREENYYLLPLAAATAIGVTNGNGLYASNAYLKTNPQY